MTEEQLKAAYLAEKPDQALRGRVLSACRLAKQRKAVHRRRLVSAAACFAVVLALSLYGFSPVPQISSGGVTIPESGLLLKTETLPAGGAHQPRMAMFSLGSEEEEDGIALSLDHAAYVRVTAGTLYAVDAEQGLIPLGREGDIPENTTFYWQGDGTEAVQLTARAGLRTVILELRTEDGNAVFASIS